MPGDRITLAMGSGGAASRELLEEIFLPILGNSVLNALDDAAGLTLGDRRIAFTTDSYTVQPLFFPGGDIGSLAVCGTINDLAAMGASPVAMSAAFIIEEGFPTAALKRIARSMRDTADRSGLSVVTADTKVVGRGALDRIFITTSGLGAILETMRVSASGARSGDAIIISGTIADHGIAVLNARERLGITPEIRSDVAPLFPLVEGIADLGAHIHAMRDPTRGGVASALNEIARASRVTMSVVEDSVPLRPAVRACCDLLGMDPLYIANEGKLIILCAHAVAKSVVDRVRSLPGGADAAIIGTVDGDARPDEPFPVRVRTALGTERFLPLGAGEMLPRIC